MSAVGGRFGFAAARSSLRLALDFTQGLDQFLLAHAVPAGNGALTRHFS